MSLADLQQQHINASIEFRNAQQEYRATLNLTHLALERIREARATLETIPDIPENQVFLVTLDTEVRGWRDLYVEAAPTLQALRAEAVRWQDRCNDIVRQVQAAGGAQEALLARLHGTPPTGEVLS